MLGTWSDVAFATSSLAYYGHNAGCIHMEAAKYLADSLREVNYPILQSTWTHTGEFMHRDDCRSFGA